MLVHLDAAQTQHTELPRLTPGLVLLSRGYCHLCDDMLAALQREGLNPTIIDVDADPALEREWDEKVPVLLLHGQYICHYHFDAQALQAAITFQPAAPDTQHSATR